MNDIHKNFIITKDLKEMNFKYLPKKNLFAEFDNINYIIFCQKHFL